MGLTKSCDVPCAPVSSRDGGGGEYGGEDPFPLVSAEISPPHREEYWTLHFGGPIEWAHHVVSGGFSETRLNMTYEARESLTISDEAWERLGGCGTR